MSIKNKWVFNDKKMYIKIQSGHVVLANDYLTESNFLCKSNLSLSLSLQWRQQHHKPHQCIIINLSV